MTIEQIVILAVFVLVAWMVSSHNYKKRTRFDELDVNQDGSVDATDLEAAKTDLRNSAKKISKLTKRVK